MSPRLSIKIPSRTIASVILTKARRATQETIRKLPSQVKDLIGREADRVLHSTAEAYKAGLEITIDPSGIISSGKIMIRMRKGLPTALEMGFDGFDIKPGLMARAQKFGKDGKPYIDVPMGASQGALGRMRQTIRRISAKSNPASWLHPGFQGVKAFERLGPEIQKMVKDSFTAAMKGK